MAIGTLAAIGLGLGAAGTAVQAISGSNAASQAAKTQEQGSHLAAQVQRESLTQQQKQFDTNREDALRVYDQSRSDLGPYRDVGSNALLALSDQLGLSRPAGMENKNTGNPSFREDPGYKFAFDEGTKAVDSRFNGMSRSGAKAKALTQFGQGVADQQYNNWLDRYFKLAGAGQTATGQQASLGSSLTSNLSNIGAANANALGNYATNAGNLAENAAAARASGYVGSANQTNAAIGGGVNNILSMFGSGAFGGGSNNLAALTNAGIVNNPNLF